MASKRASVPFVFRANRTMSAEAALPQVPAGRRRSQAPYSRATRFSACRRKPQPWRSSFLVRLLLTAGVQKCLNLAIRRQGTCGIFAINCRRRLAITVGAATIRTFLAAIDAGCKSFVLGCLTGFRTSGASLGAKSGQLLRHGRIALHEVAAHSA